MIEVRGVPVDMARHGDAFRRTKFEIYREPGTEDFERNWSWPSEPRVRCRDVSPDDEIPESAAQIATLAGNAGYDVRTTFAMGGTSIPRRSKGLCWCGALVQLYVETGFMREHPLAGGKVACPGQALNDLDVCESCGQKAKALKNGGLGKHYLKQKCPQVEQPKEVVKIPDADPDSCVAVRVKGIGVGSWIKSYGKWSFDVAFVRGDRTWVSVDMDEFKRRCAQ